MKMIEEFKEYLGKVGVDDFWKLKKVWNTIYEKFSIRERDIMQYNFSEEYKKELEILKYYNIIEEIYDFDFGSEYKVIVSPMVALEINDIFSEKIKDDSISFI